MNLIKYAFSFMLALFICSKNLASKYLKEFVYLNLSFYIRAKVKSIFVIITVEVYSTLCNI